MSDEKAIKPDKIRFADEPGLADFWNPPRQSKTLELMMERSFILQVSFRAEAARLIVI